MPKILVTEQQWVERGAEWFAEGGEKALVVEKMAASLGCSKSSFYWYFTDRRHFLDRIVDAWEERARQALEAGKGGEGPVDERIRALLAALFAPPGGGDFVHHLRELGSKEPRYAHALEEIERKRVRVLGNLLRERGAPPRSAERKSLLIYHCSLGWAERHKRRFLSEEETQKQVQSVWEELILPAGDAP